jgi:hypothetical protein
MEGIRLGLEATVMGKQRRAGNIVSYRVLVAYGTTDHSLVVCSRYIARSINSDPNTLPYGVTSNLDQLFYKFKALISSRSFLPSRLVIPGNPPHFIALSGFNICS